MKDQRIEEYLQRLNGYVIQLKKIAEIDIDNFVKDDITVAATERILQLTIETCINIGNRIVSTAQSVNEIQIPETYSDIFRSLVQLQIVESNKLENFVKW